MFNVTVSGGCQIGDKRKYNQDNFYLNGQFRKNIKENNNLFLILLLMMKYRYMLFVRVWEEIN